jgi:hypothetical protein
MAVEDAGQHLHEDDQDSEGLREQGDGLVEVDFQSNDDCLVPGIKTGL